MDVDTLEGLLLDTFPRKVDCAPGDVAADVAVLRGLFEWMAREFDVGRARQCAGLLTDDFASLMEKRMHDPANWGMAKSAFSGVHPADMGLPLPTPPIRRTSPKIGRNAPCPCGSGRKYKKCCIGSS